MNKSEKGKRDKLSRLFKAATERFGEEGFNETTMDSIAEEAGVSKGTLYYYFDSKEELFLELLLNWIEKIEDRWDEAEGTGSSVEELTGFHRTMVATVAETTSLGKLMLEFWANASRKKNLEEILNEMLNEYRTRVADLINKGVEQGTFRQVDSWAASSALLAAYDGLWFHWLLAPDSFKLEKAGKELITNFIRGLGKEDFAFEQTNGGDV